MVLAAVTVSDNESPLPFFPLLVEYREKTYAAGKIPGGFIKREGRPHDAEILAARIIDRSIRPLFPEGFKNEVQVFIYVISADQENDADVLGARRRVVRAQRVEDSVRRPDRRACASAASRATGSSTRRSSSSSTATWRSSSPASNDSIMMVEGGALEVSEADVLEALTRRAQAASGADRRSRKSCSRKAGARRRWRGRRPKPPTDLVTRVKALAEGEDQRSAQPEGQAHAHPGGRAREEGRRRAAARRVPRQRRRTSSTLLGDIEYNALRSQVLDTGQARRRPQAERGPRDHDRHAACCRAPTARRCSRAARRRRSSPSRSAPRTTCSASTSIDDAGETTKSFMLHYNFPPFSTGEVRPMRGTSRVARSATATWPSARCRACCRRSRSSRTRSASCPTSSSRTARRRWRRSAAARSRCSTPAFRSAPPSPAWRWA